MRNFKKFLTLVLAVMMVVSAMSFSTFAATTKFADVDADNETLVEAVDLLSYMGITKGVSETSFGADQNVTREQFALFMYRLMKGGKDAPAKASNTTNFKDLEDQTYFYAISWAYAEGIVNGKSDVAFGPKDGITLQEAYTMVVRALDYEEEETLIYPHGYIEVAEKLDVELDEGLPSDLGYEDTLTRADMAIILYNAFFAETGVAEVKTRERGLGWDGTEYKNYVLEEYTTYPRLCEKSFEVLEVEYQVEATPYFQVAGAEATYDLGYEAMYLTKIDSLISEVNADATEAPGAVYLTAEELGLAEGKLDDYFLGEFTMFVTLDDDDEIERVLFADCNMTKKTVNDIKLATVSSNKAASYYTDADAKLLSGKMTVGTEEIYAFNAPYTYAKNSYATGATEFAKYLTRNEENIEKVSFDVLEDGDVTYYEATVEEFIAAPVDSNDDGKIDDDYFTEQAEALVAAIPQVYYEGLYEADIYDVNGDGIYDLINYKPYAFFQVDSDDDYDFTDSELDQSIPYVYTNEAILSGVEFADEDYVIGVLDADNEIVKVVEVIKPTVAEVKSIKGATNSIVLADDTKVNVASAWKLVANFLPEDVVYDVDDFEDYVAENSDYLENDILDEEEHEFYIYNNILLYSDDVDSNLTFTENLIIPLWVNDDTAAERQWNSESGDRVYYIYAWVDGATKYIPVEDDVEPAIISGGDLTDAYNKQLCSYSVDADGIYTITSLGFNEDEDGEYDGINKDIAELTDPDDDDIQYIALGEEIEGIEKIASSRYDIGADVDAVFKSYTKILILNKTCDNDSDAGTCAGCDDCEFEVKEFDASNFKDSTEDTFFYNASYILSNNPDSKNRENLVVLFACVDGDISFAGKEDKNGQRIVALATPGQDDNGDYRYYYELLNPFTGAKETEVPGKKTASKASSLVEVFNTGDIVELKSGLVDDKSGDTVGAIDTSDASTGLVWITEYDAADNYITVVPVEATEGACCEEDFDAIVESYTYSGDYTNFDGELFVTAEGKETGSPLFYEIDKNTAISVLKYGDAGSSTTKWGTITAADVKVIADANKDYKCYNEKDTDSKGNYKTSYAEFIKAYVSASQASDEEDTPVADYIVIIVNGAEESVLLETAKEKNCEHYEG